jgi:hypothetical protein
LIARLRHVAGADPHRREAREQRDETVHGVVG